MRKPKLEPGEMTLEDVCEFVGRDKRTVHRWTTHGVAGAHLPAPEYRGRKIYRRATLLAFLTAVGYRVCPQPPAGLQRLEVAPR